MGRTLHIKNLETAHRCLQMAGVTCERVKATRIETRDYCVCSYEQLWSCCQCGRQSEDVEVNNDHIVISPEWARCEWGIEPSEERYLVLHSCTSARHMPYQLEALMRTIPGCSMSGMSHIDSWAYEPEEDAA